MKALLINPPTGKYIRDDRCQVPADAISSSLRAPMDLLYYATILKNRGYECRLRDYPGENVGWDAYAADIEGWRPDVLVASVTTPTLKDDLACVAYAKGALPRLMTLAKGAHLIGNDRQVMETCPALDIAIRQEAEKAIDELFSGSAPEDVPGITFRRGGEVVRNPDRPQIRDLDWMPAPDRSLSRNELYVRPDTGETQATILCARGCPKSCIFCLVKVVTGRPISQRSPGSIVAEIEACVRDFGIRNFYFRADTFTWYKPWVMEICDLLIEKDLDVQWVCNSRADTVGDEMLAKMKRAGCWMIGLGMESGSEEILRKIKKGITLDEARGAARLIRKHGIRTYNFFIIGFPWDDERTIAETVDFAIELDSDFVEFHTAYPFPGTELAEVAERYGLYEGERVHGSDVMTSPIRTLHLSTARLHELRRRAIRRYYLRPSYVWRTLAKAGSPAVFGNYVRKGVQLLKSL